MGVRRRLQLKLSRGGAIEKPALEHAVFDELELVGGDAFGVERPRTQAALAQRIVDHIDTAAEQPRAELIAQERGLARDRGAVRGAGEMTEERSGNSWIEHDRHAAGFDFARIEPLDRAFAGVAADRFGAVQIGGVQGRGIIVVLLHRRAAAGNRRH